MNEVEISIKGLFFNLLSHWKSIVAVAAVTALALSGLQALRNPDGDNGSANTNSDINISESDKEYIEAVYEYLNGFRLLNSANNNLLVMQIDPNNVAQVELAYVICTENPDYLEGIAQVYEQALNGLEYKVLISEENGLSVPDVSDVVSVKMGENNYSSSVSSFTILISGINLDEAEGIAKTTITYLDNKNNTLCEDGFQHSITLLGTQKYIGFNEGILNRQIEISGNYQARNKTIVDSEYVIRGSLKDYYDYLVMTGGDDGNFIESYENDKTAPSINISPKYLIFGFVAGMFLMCGIYFVIYLFANRLDEDDDVEKIFGVGLLGKISPIETKKLIYKVKNFGRRTINFNESINLVSSRIRIIAEKKNIKKIAIIGCGIKKHNEKAVKMLTDNMTKYGLETVVVDDVLYDPEMVKSLDTVEDAVIIEKTGSVYRTEVMSEIEIARKMNINIEGIVITE